MFSKPVNILVLISVLLIVSFLLWHFWFSIYEVNYKIKFDAEKLKVGNNYKISVYGINFWGRKFFNRNLQCDFSIEGKHEIVKIKTQKNYCTIIPLKPGKFRLTISSKFSRNPSYIDLSIVESK